MDESIIFLFSALEFINEIWDDEDEKCTQNNIAKRLGCTSGYISKAKENPNYVRKLMKPIKILIESFGGKYLEEKRVFIDKDGKPFQSSFSSYDYYKLEKMNGLKLVRILLGRNKNGKLQILTTWLGEIYNDILYKLNENPRILDRLNEIQILLLHPSSYGSLLRSHALSSSSELGFNKIKEDMYNLHSLFNEYKKNGKNKKLKIELRLYHSLPSVNLIISDDSIVAGLYTCQKNSRDIEQIIIDRSKGSEFGKTLEQHFQAVWRASEKNKLEPDEIQAVADKLKAPPYKRYNSSHYKKIIGTYEVLFPEKYSSHHNFRDNKIATSIGCNILEIKVDEHDNLICNMKALKISSHDEEDVIQIYEGELINTKFNNPEYAILNFTNQTKTRFFNILVSLNQDFESAFFLGVFSMIYRTSGRIGAGYVILNKLDKEKYELLNPKIAYPSKNEPPPNIIGYLINRKESLITSIPPKELISKNYIIDEYNLTGTYNLYAPNRSERTITKGILTLFETGLVRYKNQRSGYHGIGWASIDSEAGRDKRQVNLYINISNSNPDINRSGFFILKINKTNENTQNKSKKPSDKRAYYGISVTPTWKEAFPMGAKIIMEKESDIAEDDDFIDRKPEKILVDSSKYKKLPDKVRNLIGTSSNLISFLDKPDDREINYKEVFYKAACFDDSNGEDLSCERNLEHAVSHGIIEEEARLIDNNKDVLRKLRKLIKKVSEY